VVDPLGLYGWEIYRTPLNPGGLEPGKVVQPTLPPVSIPKPAKDFLVQAGVGADEVLNPIQPPGGFAMPDSDAGVAGRVLGRTAGLLVAFAEVKGGTAIAGSSAGGGLILALPTGGTATIPAAAGVTLGGALAVKGALDISRATQLPGIKKIETSGGGGSNASGDKPPGDPPGNPTAPGSPDPGKIPGKNNFTGPDGPARAFVHLEKYQGLNPETASVRLHKIKQKAQLGPADDVTIGRTGDVYNAATGDKLGSLTDPSWGGSK
jgi:hypothetical protein